MINKYKLKDGIDSIINSIPEPERYAAIRMLEAFNPLEGVKKTYLMPIELYCEICDIHYRGSKNENLKKSLERLDVGINQTEEGLIVDDISSIKDTVHLWRLLNDLVINNELDVIEYSFHERLYPYIVAYNEENT